VRRQGVCFNALRHHTGLPTTAVAVTSGAAVDQELVWDLAAKRTKRGFLVGQNLRFLPFLL
jgi:hypothetical protein